jgi:hypothetical protein
MSQNNSEEESKDSSPSVTRKIIHAGSAAHRAISAAMNKQRIFAPKEEMQRRSTICDSCDMWKPKGNLGFGECSHETCGCTKFKRGLLTERCPLGKWDPSIKNSPAPKPLMI